MVYACSVLTQMACLEMSNYLNAYVNIDNNATDYFATESSIRVCLVAM